MLFATIDQSILSELTATQNLIDELEAQLVIARDRRSQLEQEIQAQKAAKAAAESAIQQAKVARQLLRAAYGEEAIEEFNFELTLDEVQRDVIAAADLEVDESEPQPAPVESEPSIEVESEVIEVEATVEQLMQQADAITSKLIYNEEVADESPVELEASDIVTSQVLHRQKAKSLQWLATQKGIETRDMKRHELAKILTGQVTQVELERAIHQAS